MSKQSHRSDYKEKIIIAWFCGLRSYNQRPAASISGIQKTQGTNKVSLDPVQS